MPKHADPDAEVVDAGPGSTVTPAPGAALSGVQRAALWTGAAGVSAAVAAGAGGGETVVATAAVVGVAGTAMARTLVGAPVQGAGKDSPSARPGNADTVSTAAATQSISSDVLARFLLQAQFAATPADVSAVSSLGYDAWLTQQFNLPQSQGGYDWLVASGNTDPFKGEFFNPTPADYMIWRQLIASPDQMRTRLALALSEMFVVSTNVMDAFWPGSFMGAYWDVLTKNAFGNFRTLLEEITLNPAMGRYLNMLGSVKEDPATGRLPDENFAREVMQLFTIGLNQLTLDGSVKRDALGKPLDAYTQSDVSNLARVFTGYNYDYTGVTYTQTTFQTYRIPSPQNARTPMAFDASKHSNLEKTFLGVTVPANTPGPTALRTALDTLFNHPNVGPFFARQMIQRLVTSNPSPAYIASVASAFNNNGSGVRGDMKAFWRALLMNSEARQLPLGSSAGRVREPMVRAVQWARTFKATSASGKWIVYDQSSNDYGLSQSPLRSPSVFNFFRPGYVPPRTAMAAAGLVAPEFQIHNESSTVGYLNYMTDWVGDTFSYGDIVPNYTDLLTLAADAAGLVQWLNTHLSGGQLSLSSVNAIVGSVSSLTITRKSRNSVRLQRIYAAVALVMASPEYIVQK